MGNEWHQQQGATEYGAKADAKARAEANRRISDALAEGERARKILAEDERRYRVALTEFEQRVKALPELGHELGSPQQAAELDTIAALLTTAQSRGSIMRARRGNGTGLYKRTTGRDLPAFEPYQDDPCPLCGSYRRSDRRQVGYGMPIDYTAPCTDSWHEDAAL